MTGFNLYDINFWFGSIGTLAIVASIVRYLRRRKSYEISCSFDGMMGIINEKSSNLTELRLIHGSSEIHNARKLFSFNCYLQNTGLKDIDSDLIKTPFKIIVPQSMRLISANSIDFPIHILSTVNLDKSKGEIIIPFELLQTGEVIKIQLVVELIEEIQANQIWAEWRQVGIDFRIKNVKPVPWQFLPNRSPASLLLELTLTILAAPFLFGLMWLIFSQPYKVVENKYLTEYSIANRKFYGDLFFINNDSVAIRFVYGDRIDTVMSRNDFFNLATVNRRMRRKATELPETKLIIIGLSLSLLLMAYTPYRRYRLRRILDKALSERSAV